MITHLVASIGGSLTQEMFLDHKQDVGRKLLMHGKVRDAKEGGSNYVKFPPAYSKLNLRPFGM